VTAAKNDGRLTIVVSDNGVGGARTDLGSGLRPLSDWLAAIEGRLDLESEPVHGTTLPASIPCLPGGRSSTGPTPTNRNKFKGAARCQPPQQQQQRPSLARRVPIPALAGARCAPARRRDRLIDVTIVNVAIPSIQADLGATAAAIEWIVAGFTLAFAGLLRLEPLSEAVSKGLEANA
jgi:hypothetical protein